MTRQCLFVSGFLFILTMAIWPLLPVLVPAHISGALTIVVTLRYVLQHDKYAVNERALAAAIAFLPNQIRR